MIDELVEGNFQFRYIVGENNQIELIDVSQVCEPIMDFIFETHWRRELQGKSDFNDPIIKCPKNAPKLMFSAQKWLNYLNKRMIMTIALVRHTKNENCWFYLWMTGYAGAVLLL